MSYVAALLMMSFFLASSAEKAKAEGASKPRRALNYGCEIKEGEARLAWSKTLLTRKECKKAGGRWAKKRAESSGGPSSLKIEGPKPAPAEAKAASAE